VILAEDGKEAIKKIIDNKDTIQLVLLDMIMPNMGGKEAYDEIRKMRPDIRVLFSSGYAEDRLDKGDMLTEGFDFIVKPASPSDLLRKIREVLDK
jgi:CheY-like chemotaxis protein